MWSCEKGRVHLARLPSVREEAGSAHLNRTIRNTFLLFQVARAGSPFSLFCMLTQLFEAAKSL